MVIAFPIASSSPDMTTSPTARSLDEAKVTDWPLSGPRSVRWILKFTGGQCNTGPTGRLQQFMSLCKLSFQDKYVSEYAVLCKIFEYAIQYHQLRVSNLACMELVSRRLQLIEEKYRFRMPQPEGNAGVTDPENDRWGVLSVCSYSSRGKFVSCSHFRWRHIALYLLIE